MISNDIQWSITMPRCQINSIKLVFVIDSTVLNVKRLSAGEGKGGVMTTRKLDWPSYNGSLCFCGMSSFEG